MSVRPSVRPSVCPSVRPSFRPCRVSVRPGCVSVRASVRPCVRASVRPSVRPSVRAGTTRSAPHSMYLTLSPLFTQPAGGSGEARLDLFILLLSLPFLLSSTLTSFFYSCPLKGNSERALVPACVRLPARSLNGSSGPLDCSEADPT